MLVNEQRKKLSKRRDPVAVESYRNQGYLSEAFRNYLALLGMKSAGGRRDGRDRRDHPPDFRSRGRAPRARFFDVKKLMHLNGEYIRQLSTAEFISASRPWVAPVDGEWSPEGEGPVWPPERFDAAVYERLAPLVQERVAVLGEVPAMVDFVFLPDPRIDAASWEKVVSNDPGALGILHDAVALYEDAPWEAGPLHDATASLAEARGRKLGKAQAPIRVAVTGRTVGPPLFESLEVLGRAEVLRRLRTAIARATAAPVS